MMKRTQATSWLQLSFAIALASLCLLVSAGQAQVRTQSVVQMEITAKTIPALTEEQLIRRAYLRLQFYQAAGKRQTVERGDRPHNPEEDLYIRVSNVQTGPISEIYHRPYRELISNPGGEIIHLVQTVKTVNNEPEEFIMYDASWITGDFILPPDLSIRQFLEIGGPSYADVEKYAAYEVFVRLEGKERFYRALAIYHAPPQSSADSKIEFLDPIIGWGGRLTKIFNERNLPVGATKRSDEDLDRYRLVNQEPPPFSSTDSQPRTPVRHGIRGATGIEESSQLALVHREKGASRLSKDSTGFGQGFYEIRSFVEENEFRHTCDETGLCCPSADTFLLECCSDPLSVWANYLPICFGGFGDDGGRVSKGDGNDKPTLCEARTVKGQAITKPDSDTRFHLLGSHRGSSTIQGFCNIDRDCSATCDSDFIDIYQEEDGLTQNHFIPVGGLIYRHTMSSPQKRSATSAGFVHNGNTPPTCSGAVGFAVKSCALGMFCDLGVTILGNPFGLSVNGDKDPLWVYSHTSTFTCPK